MLYDFETRTVVGKNKALTTHHDLKIGILNALDGLDQTLCRQAVLAGLSTTLATNACVEGKFRRTRLLLLGLNRRGVERYGGEYGLTDPDDIRYLPCKTTIDGAVLEEPDWDALRANAKAWFHDVEAAFRRTRLLLLGLNRRGVERYGGEYGLTDPDDIRYLPCKTTIDGAVLEEPDWDALRANAKAWFHDVEAAAVCEIYGVRNGGVLEQKAAEILPDWDALRANAKAWFHDVEAAAVCEIYGVRNGGVLEQKAAEILTEETGLPVMCASVLFSGLSSLERAASALLNAGLLPVTNHFLNAVKDAFHQRGITADLMIVRSDSSLMSCEYSAKHAVETLLSGPAASALGGCALTGADYAVAVDIGGTTTDIALVPALWSCRERTRRLRADWCRLRGCS